MKFSIENILKDDRKELAVERRSITTAASPITSVEHRTFSEVSTRASSPESSGSCCSDDVSQDTSHRRPRTAITIWQRDRLEVLFESQRYPAAEKIEMISEQLGLPQHVVKVWFQNRRAKLRKEGIKKRKTTTFVNTSPQEHFHRIANVMQASEYPRQINDKEIELVHSRGNQTRQHSQRLVKSPSQCPCCAPSSSQKQYAKPVQHDYLSSLPELYSDRYHSKPYHSFHVPEQHPSLPPMLSEGNVKCCCVNCRYGTFYAKY